MQGAGASLLKSVSGFNFYWLIPETTYLYLKQSFLLVAWPSSSTRCLSLASVRHALLLSAEVMISLILDLEPVAVL